MTDFKIIIREIRCSSVLHRLLFRDSSEYTANFYRGCTHGCDYCYAPSLIHDERSWGSYVDVKVNAAEVLRRELRKTEKSVVFLSSASDPYQPVEARYRVTRRCLEILLANQFPVLILTRSPLVLRDIDILKKFEWIRVGFSISTICERYHEPGVVPAETRLRALSKLKQGGIVTWVSLAPMIPGLPMLDLELLFRKIKEAGVSSVSAGLLRFDGYKESRKMFEERSGVDSHQAIRGGSDILEKARKLSLINEFEDPDSLLALKEHQPKSLECFQQ